MPRINHRSSGTTEPKLTCLKPPLLSGVKINRDFPSPWRYEQKPIWFDFFFFFKFINLTSQNTDHTDPTLQARVTKRQVSIGSGSQWQCCYSCSGPRCCFTWQWHHHLAGTEMKQNLPVSSAPEYLHDDQTSAFWGQVNTMIEQTRLGIRQIRLGSTPSSLLLGCMTMGKSLILSWGK